MLVNNILLHFLDVEVSGINADIPKYVSEFVWNEIIQQAKRQRVAPLLYQRLKAFQRTIPSSIFQKLQENYLHTALRNTYIHKELFRILRALHNSCIPVVLLKGVALAELVYQDIALRPMNDIDLLIRDRDRWRGHKVLSKIGCGLQKISWNEMQYRKGSIPLELKGKLSDLPKLDIWANVSRAKTASVDALVLRPEVFLLHLCLHADRHLNGAQTIMLIWWFDIKMLIEHYQEKLNWGYVIQIAREHGVECTIRRILHMVREDFGAHIPMDVLDRLKNDGTSMSVHELLGFSNKLVSKQEMPPSQLQQASLPLQSTLERSPYHDIVYQLLRGAFPNREYMIQRYSIKHPIYIYFYYFARIAAGAIGIAKRLFQSCFS